MRVSSYSVVHYGVSYLQFALKAISPLVNRSLIFYTPHPSHGHQADISPIETREELMASISEWDKLTWVDTDNFWYEGQQRDYALKVASEDADICLVVDYDEIWDYQVLEQALNYVWKQNRARTWLINFSHLWRSFNYVINDDAWPVRIFDLRHSSGLAYLPKELGPIWHFGYAIKTETLKYKLSIHGHKDELRPEWFAEKWLAWPPVDDCHPTNGRKQNGEGWWNPKPFDKWQLPEVLRSHPWWDVDKIE